MIAAIGFLAVSLAAEPLAPPACNQVRLVALGSGCLEVPCEYRAIVGRPGPDSIGGRIESSGGKNIIYWSEYNAGFWFFLQRSSDTVWRRPAIHGWHLWWHELVEQLGKQMYVVTDGNFSLVVEEPGPASLSILEALASSYRSHPKTGECQNPERWHP